MGWVGGSGFEVLFDFAGEAGAFVEAEHSERAGEFVGRSVGLLAEFGCQQCGRGLIEQGEALKNLGLVAVPQGGDKLMGRGLRGVLHVVGTKEIVNFSVLVEILSHSGAGCESI